ncbi:cellulase family glycosylhydrolase [Paradesertivirga mongoliensis]|uniref:Cellulase family glycosylhydrolase n=1 Tax=Paradesertivirga mongoliensis TaxID=2100740 RepID=A0ABW4ZSC8_9SPHI|nr:cellulase family glycosylhydrolase [Pedobacter mongoliensis]
MKFLKTNFLLLIVTAFLLQSCAVQPSRTQSSIKWTKEKANKWYAKQGWLAGANFIPSTAINQLEMWQAASFDTATINRELGLAESIGMNTMRVYLHDLLWDQDSTGFVKRMNTFLEITQRHKIKPMFVLFDSCWDPFPKLGTQRSPTPFVHNSGWVQSPGYEALKDSTQYPRLERYVKGVVRNFRNDKRVLAWDVWNEPDNTNNSSYGKRELPNKVQYVFPLLKKTFEWSRSVNPSQPLTSGVWLGDWSSPEKMKEIDKLQLEESDIITFHNYDSSEEFEKRIKWLQPLGRPVICTEYMARGNRSTFQGSMPIAKKYNVGVYNWGLVDGKTQTKMPWDSWDKKYTGEPVIWFHEIFHTDGRPYRHEEIVLIKKLTSDAKATK